MSCVSGMLSTNISVQVRCIPCILLEVLQVLHWGLLIMVKSCRHKVDQAVKEA